MLKKIISNLLNIIFPKNCFGCNQSGEYFCKTCFKKISTPKKLIYKKHNHSYDEILFCTSYHKMPELKKLIKAFKYKGIKESGDVLSQIMTMRLKSNKNMVFDAITYVPMHKNRKLKRIFNHAEILSMKVAKNINFKHKKLLKKVINTEQQAKLEFSDRLTNLNNSFAINNATNIKNKHILLIDDISTTGATLHECSKVLKNNGASTVTALVLAKTNY